MKGDCNMAKTIAVGSVLLLLTETPEPEGNSWDTDAPNASLEQAQDGNSAVLSFQGNSISGNVNVRDMNNALIAQGSFQYDGVAGTFFFQALGNPTVAANIRRNVTRR
jgi:hypothetical protein